MSVEMFWDRLKVFNIWAPVDNTHVTSDGKHWWWLPVLILCIKKRIYDQDSIPGGIYLCIRVNTLIIENMVMLFLIQFSVCPFSNYCSNQQLQLDCYQQWFGWKGQEEFCSLTYCLFQIH